MSQVPLFVHRDLQIVDVFCSALNACVWILKKSVIQTLLVNERFFLELLFLRCCFSKIGELLANVLEANQKHLQSKTNSFVRISDMIRSLTCDSC